MKTKLMLFVAFLMAVPAAAEEAYPMQKAKTTKTTFKKSTGPTRSTSVAAPDVKVVNWGESSKSSGGQYKLEFQTTHNVYGFQFKHKGCAKSANGGMPMVAGFNVATSDTIVLGFALHGAHMAGWPESTYKLLVQTTEACGENDLSDFMFVSADGTELSHEYSWGGDGCDDPDACNNGAEYDPCEWPETGYDCAGNCIVGSDECGVCGGTGIEEGKCNCAGAEKDCAGTCGGSAEKDACGVCNGDGTACAEDLWVHFNSDVDIYGFQFHVNTVTPSAASGGKAEEAGFQVFVSGNTHNVIGFSFNGAKIVKNFPATENAGSRLTKLRAGGQLHRACLSEVHLTGVGGSTLPANVRDCTTLNYCGDSCRNQVKFGLGVTEGTPKHLDIYYTADAAFTGFQFELSGLKLKQPASGARACTGGKAEQNGFTVRSNADGMVLGYSLTGGSIPAHTETLGSAGSLLTACEIQETTATKTCLSRSFLVPTIDKILEGDCLTFESPTSDCEDTDSDGVCDDVDDCIGVEDDCNICNGPGKGDDCDCKGEGNVNDSCGVCGGDGTSCLTTECTLGIQQDIDKEYMITYTTTQELAGFQFTATNFDAMVTLSAFIAGDANTNQFHLSHEESTDGTQGFFMGFSFEGGTIPAGSGVLAKVKFNGKGIVKLSDVICSGVGGVVLGSETESDAKSGYHVVPTCADGNSNGKCDATECAPSLLDVCGVCNGAGVPTGYCDCHGRKEDLCGICGGSNDCSYTSIKLTQPDQNKGELHVTYNTTGTSAIYTYSFTIGKPDEITSVTLHPDAPHGFKLNADLTTGEIFGFTLEHEGMAAGEGVLAVVKLTGAGYRCLSDLSVLTKDGAVLQSHLDKSSDGCNTLCVDTDADGECECNGTEDICGVCYGTGLSTGKCDCDGHTEDECGVCGGHGISDGYCDCEGRVLDECNVCGGTGIPDGECNCNGETLDCAGECGGSARSCPEWYSMANIPVSELYEDHKTVFVQAFHDGEKIWSTSDRMVAMDGNGTIRSVGFLRIPASGLYHDQGIWELRMNGQTGDIINFQYFDAELDTVLYRQETYTWGNSLEASSSLDFPRAWKFRRQNTVSLHFEVGWNWMSVNVGRIGAHDAQSEGMTPNFVFGVEKNGTADAPYDQTNDVSFVTTQRQAATFYPGWGFFGSLKSISPLDMFKAKSAVKKTMTVSGIMADPSATRTMIEGWNWIGFWAGSAMTVSDALSTLDGSASGCSTSLTCATDNSALIGDSGSSTVKTSASTIPGHTGGNAMYYEAYGWYGSLTENLIANGGGLRPGVGYMIQLFCEDCPSLSYFRGQSTTLTTTFVEDGTASADCVGSWGEWGACSVTCQADPDQTIYGLKERTFTITTQATGAGKACSYSSQQRQCTDPDPDNPGQVLTCYPETAAPSPTPAPMSVASYCPCSRAKPCLHDNVGDNTCHAKNSYGECPTGTTACWECVEKPEEWKSSIGSTCERYGDKNYCTLDGYGSGWRWGFGTFARYAVDGVDASQACCECGGGTMYAWATFGTHRYALINTLADWETQKKACEDLDAHMVTIESQAENDFVVSLMPAKTTERWQWLWIGMTKSSLDGWIDGSSLDYTNWAANQPSGEDCAEIYRPTGDNWHDNACSATSRTVCERSESVDCVGSWGSWGDCSVTCGDGTHTRSFVVTVEAAHGGTECAADDGSTLDATSTESQTCTADLACPEVDQDCEGSWSACTTACEPLSQRVFTVTTLQAGSGSACPAGTDCQNGDGDCVINNDDCVGEWSACTAACETASARTFTVTTPQSGSGAACPATATDCQAGEGACPGSSTCTDNPVGWYSSAGNTCDKYVEFNYCAAGQAYASGWIYSSITFEDYANDGVDASQACCDCGGGTTVTDINCVGTWSECTTACEVATERTFTETTAQSGSGSACPTTTDCQPGEGQCPPNVDCTGTWSECTAGCEAAAYRTWNEITAQSGTGSDCPTATNCQPGEGQCPPNVDCVGTWSACTPACEAAGARTFTETTAKSGAGAACPAATDCQPGEDQCPPDVDCAGTWSACTAACETSDQRTFTETAAQSGNGAACPAATDCQPGEDQCPPDVDCAGTWSECTAACEAADQRTFTETIAQSGNGAACPAAADCEPGEGACPIPDVDCAGTWSACTTACETSDQRTFTETAAQSGNGAACPAATDCQPGVDQCPPDVDCAGTWSECTAACEGAGQRTFTETIAQSGNGAECPAAIDCYPGEGACPASTATTTEAGGTTTKAATTTEHDDDEDD